MCAFCGKLDENFLCENCRKEVEKIEKLHIDKYNKEKIYYNEHIYLFKYKDYIRTKILAYKFNDKPYYYKTFVKVLLNNKKVCEILKSYDIIIPVPIHNKRKKERGYNQTELIAKEIVRELRQKQQEIKQLENTKILKNSNKLECLNLLYKKVNTKPQSTLNKKQRIENANNVYELKNTIKLEMLREKNILIFDDIYTTGSTVNECAKVIRQVKPNKIGVFTIAKD